MLPPNLATTSDFDKQLAEWQAKASAGYKLLQETQAKVNQRLAQIETLGKELTEPGGFKYPTGIGALGFNPQSVVQIKKQQIQRLKDEVTLLSVDATKQELYNMVYNDVPYTILGGKAATPDEVLALIPSTYTSTLTTQERADWKSVITEMFSTIRGARPVAEVKATEFPELVSPETAESKVGMASLQQLTTKEILKGLNVPKVPPSVMTREEWESYLKQAGMSTEPDAQALDLVAQWQERANQIQAFQQGVGSIPDYKFGDMFRDYVLTPGLAMADAFTIYYEHVAAPLAGRFYTNTGVLKTLVPVQLGGIAGAIAGAPGGPVGAIGGAIFGVIGGALVSAGIKPVFERYNIPDVNLWNVPDLNTAYDNYKLTNTEWQAAGLAWANYDMNWGLKVISETFVDPMTLVGWGVATKLTKPIPYVGRLVGAGESLFNEAMGLPFQAMRQGWLLLPKTVTQRALIVERNAMQLTKTTLESMFKKPFVRITGEEFTEKIAGFVDKSITYAQEHPYSDSNIASFGRELLSHQPVDEALTKRWATAMGVTLPDDQVTKEFVDKVNDIFEDFFTTRKITVDEAAARLRTVFNVANSEKSITASLKVLGDHADSIGIKAEALGASKTFREFGTALGRRNSQIYIDTSNSAAYLARKQMGAFHTFLLNTSQPLSSIWRNQIDRMIIRPFAEAYLTFGMYGPMNVLEDYIRAALGHTTPGTMNVETFGLLAEGLSVDPQLTLAGQSMSDMIGSMTARSGGSGEWNNWVLQVATLGQKKWADKLYTGLVRLPGAYSMEVRTNFVANKYLQLLQQSGDDRFLALMVAGPGGLPNITDTKLAQKIANTVHYLKTTADPKTIRSALDMFTRKKVVRGEINDILMKHPEVSNTAREQLLRAFDDNTLMVSPQSINGIVDTSMSTITDEFIRSPERASEQFTKLADQLTAMEVTSPDDLATLMINLRVMSNTYGMLPDNIMAQASIRSRGMKFASRNEVINADMDRLVAFIDRSGMDLQRVVEKVTNSFGKAGADGEFVDNATKLFQVLTTKRQLLDNFRLENIGFRKEFFAGSTAAQRKTGAFWDKFYTQDDLMRKELSVQVAKLDGEMTRMLAQWDTSRGMGLPSRAAVKVTNRAVSPADIAAILQCRSDDITKSLLDVMTVQSNRDEFIQFVRAYVKPGDEGFTEESVGKVYDQIVADITQGGNRIDWMTQQKMALEGIRQDLHHLYNGKLLPDNEVQEIRDYIFAHAKAVEDITHVQGAVDHPDVAKFLATPDGQIANIPKSIHDAIRARGYDPTNMSTTELKQTLRQPLPEVKGKGRVKAEFGTSYREFRQKAMDEAHKWYYREFVDYTHANAFDAFLKNVFPYWTYESQRWLWLPRQFLQHPGLLTTFERYQTNTEGGRIHIPGTSLDVNPLRGTIFGAAAFRNQRRDYASYYDQLGIVGGPLKVLDVASRYGFYPNAFISGISSAFGGVEPQMGEILPSIWKSPLDLAVGLFPKNEFVKTISDRIFHDRFRDYLTVLEVTSLGGDGLSIWSKQQRGEKLTPEEEALWSHGRSLTGFYGALFEQTGLFSLNPQQRVEVQQAAAKFIEQQTGITIDQQQQLEERGIRVWDLVGGMSPSQQQVLKEMNFYRWTGLSRPILPGPQQQVLNQIDKAWEDITTYVDGLRQSKLELEGQFLGGEIGPTDYSDQLSTIYQQQRQYIEQKEKENPIITLEGRKKYYQENGIAEPVQNPMKELINLYFSIELNKVKDPVTGQLVDDWDSFWLQREAIDSAIPPEYQTEWDNFLSKNSTPMEQLRRQSQDYFRKYNEVYGAITARFTSTEQELLKEYDYLTKTGMDLIRQQEIESTMTGDGRQLVSAFRTDVSNAREALRRANPSLDAWLNYWGRVSSFKTQQAKAIYLSLMQSTGRRYQ